MMIRETAAHNLPETDFAQRGGEFTTVIWRDWLTEEVMTRMGLTERQRRALAFVKVHGRITNKDYRGLTGVIIRTASRDLEDLVGKGVLKKSGTTGRSTYYAFADKPDIKRTNRT
jgi:ATP-dependent DNA helicase RecG